MRAARKLPARELGGWERDTTPVRYSRGQLTVRPREPGKQLECKQCGELLIQQYIEGYRAGGALWAVLPCVKCPMDAWKEDYARFPLEC